MSDGGALDYTARVRRRCSGLPPGARSCIPDDSLEKPKPFIPGRVTKVEFELPDVQHAFRRGHRMMIQVQSSWFPLFDRNPQTFVNIRTAGEGDFQRATHRVYRTPAYPSAVTVNVLPGEPGGTH